MSLAIFDLDGTIIKGQSQEYLIKYLIKRGEINFLIYLIIFFWFIGYKIKIFKDPNWIMRYGARKIVKGKNAMRLRRFCLNFIKQA